MSKTDESFSAIRGAMRTLWPPDEMGHIQLDVAAGMLLLSAPNDVAAFAVLNGHPDRDFPKAYNRFKELYRDNSRVWDERTLSFVVCRMSERTEDDRYYAALETDPLFCRKYVIRAHDSVSAQRGELLRLPFLPLPIDGDGELQRPKPAQDLLKLSGVSGSFASNLIQPGRRSADRIAIDLRDGHESLPPVLNRPRMERLSVAAPRASSRLMSLRVEGFRAYREPQTFDLDASVIVLYGPNGLGKTSVFDAIDYACTGRIGRLCRTRRSQSDFARIATHLDKTPGSGSVVLAVKSDNVDGEEWRLQRSTGDWGTAWIGGQEADRKTVINKLTQASWIDKTPRQQTLDSLFRATHLFSQDEQELLTEFRKGSIIPEAFISEMLSLQDYSDGLSKLKDVLSKLSGHRDTAQAALEQFYDERTTLERSLGEDGTDIDSDEVTPIESVIADLRREVAESSLGLEPLPEASVVAAFSEWRDVAVSRSISNNERVSLAHTLGDELPAHHGRVQKQCDVQTEIDDIDRQWSEIDDEERVLGRRAELNQAELEDAEARGRQLQGRREDLRSASEALTHRAALSKQMAALTAERDRQVLIRGDLDAGLTKAESERSKAIADVSECERSVRAQQVEVTKVEELLDGLPQFAEDTALDADTRHRMADAQQGLGDAEVRRIQAAKELQEAGRARVLLEPEYQRAIAAQAESERLLNEIQSHVQGDLCPLCGSKFASVESLLTSIRRQRESRSPNADVTAAYLGLVSEESRSRDRLRIASTAVTLGKTAVEELSAIQEAADQRLQDFYGRLTTAVVIRGTDANQVREVLRRRQNTFRDQLSGSASRAETARRKLMTLETSQSDESSRRQDIEDRVTAVDREILKLTDRTKSWTAQIERVLAGSQDVESALMTESASVEKSIVVLNATLQRMQATRKRNSGAVQVLSAQKQDLSQRRSVLVATLSAVNRLVATFRQRLRTLGVYNDGDVDSLGRVIREETERSDAIGALVERTLVVLGALRAGELRRRLAETRQRLEALNATIGNCEEQVGRIKSATATCTSIDGLLKQERHGSIERHMASYGPMITMIQQRLRSVYGFGEVQLEARGGEAKVGVRWRRSKSVQVPPTDFFSDSQKQILMLSIFIAGGLRQNWSGFAPVLLDDPVTHFDDLNAYAFVELIRGLVATSSNEWQFVVSTCEQRLFDLIKRKCSRLSSGAVFYEFLGMTDEGPIVERR